MNWGWLFEILETIPGIERIVMANPLHVRLIAAAQVKTDKVDARKFAQLLRANLLPEEAGSHLKLQIKGTCDQGNGAKGTGSNLKLQIKGICDSFLRLFPCRFLAEFPPPATISISPQFVRLSLPRRGVVRPLQKSNSWNLSVQSFSSHWRSARHKFPIIGTHGYFPSTLRNFANAASHAAVFSGS
jgi:hypothetical protein